MNLESELMLKFELGKTYRVTLESNKTVDIVVYGSMAGANGTTQFDYSVNGVRGTYTDLNAALGEPFLKVERIL
jgi:hypothetical protein